MQKKKKKSLFAEDMIVYLEGLKHSTKSILDLVRKPIKVARLKKISIIVIS
jgi:hypothetical protein